MKFDAEKLKGEREKRNWSITEMCSKLVMARQQYDLIESGKNRPNIETISRIANVLGISGKALLGE